MNLKQPVVAVFDADQPTSVAFLRSLGRAGVPTRLFSHQARPFARFSRYCTYFDRCPELTDAAAFLPWLRERLRERAFDLIAPTSDLVAFFTAEAHELIPQALRAQLPDPAAVRAMLFKDEFDARCEAKGYRVPASFLPHSVEEAHAYADWVRYPAVVKARSHVAVGLERGQVVENAEELRRAFAEYPITPAWREVVERYPSLRLPMIQEYVPNALENLYSVSGLLGPGGETLAVSASRKLSQWPPKLGIGIEFEAIENAELIRHGVDLARAVLGRGIFEVELIRDERVGDWLAIDLNPRAHGFIRFDIARGNDLPTLWYRSVTGDVLVPPARPRNDLRWTHGVPLHVRHWVELLAGPDRLERARAYLSALRTNTVDIVHDPDDPLPSAPFVATMLRHPRGLVRSFLSTGPNTRSP